MFTSRTSFPCPADQRGRCFAARSETAFGLRLQALFLQHAYRYDPRSGLSNARIEPKPHQIFIAHVVTNELRCQVSRPDEEQGFRQPWLEEPASYCGTKLPT